MSIFTRDLGRHVTERNCRQLSDAMDLCSTTDEATVLLMSVLTSMANYVDAILAQSKSPYPLYRNLTKEQRMHLLLGLVWRALYSNDEDLETAQGLSDMQAASFELIMRVRDEDEPDSVAARKRRAPRGR